MGWDGDHQYPQLRIQHVKPEQLRREALLVVPYLEKISGRARQIMTRFGERKF